ncbi:MAG: segregation and condensation protein A [Cocleimonas sp.]
MSEQDETLINKEKRILAAVRKTLSSVIRDVTPTSSSLKSPISESTTQDIIMCFGLITAREQELSQGNKQKPHFIDEVKTSQTVSLDSLKATLNKPKPAEGGE